VRLKRSWRLALVTSCHVPSRGDGEDIVCQELGLLLHDGVTTEHLVLTTKMVGTVKYLTRLCIIIDNFLKYLLFFFFTLQAEAFIEVVVEPHGVEDLLSC